MFTGKIRPGRLAAIVLVGSTLWLAACGGSPSATAVAGPVPTMSGTDVSVGGPGNWSSTEWVAFLKTTGGVSSATVACYDKAMALVMNIDDTNLAVSTFPLRASPTQAQVLQRLSTEPNPALVQIDGEFYSMLVGSRNCLTA